VNYGEPVCVVFRTTVYEGEVMEGWSDEEIENWHSGDEEAVDAFKSIAVALAHKQVYPFPNEDTDVIVDGGEI
jgi:hypothetical protein